MKIWLSFVIAYSTLCPLHTFNIDIKTPYVVVGQSWESFGYSVALHQSESEKVLLVGAPQAQTFQPSIVEGGAVYRCRIPDSLEVPRQPTTCSTQINAFDPNGNKYLYINEYGEADRNSDGSLKYNYEGTGYMQENKTGQWLGVSLMSAGDNVVACAHRYIRIAHNYRKGTYDTQPVGKCSVVDAKLTSQRTEYTPCWSDTTGYDHTSCQVGGSVDLTPNEIVFGGPGANQGEGKAYMSTDFDQSSTFKTGNQATGGIVGQWYTGYSTVLCDVNGDGNEDLITAAPRAEGYKGKLLVYNRNSNVLNKQMTVNGNQIGEYFGYAMDCADVNGDGNGDVIVGAPYYSLDTSGQARLEATGRVYVYLGNREGYLESTPIVIEPEIYEGSMFGHSVKSAGDLNSDGYDDVLIGAPYNANGVVYVYLGSQKGLETEFSQKLVPEDLGVAANIDSFGWSIDGGKDLDNNDYPDVLIGALSGHVTYLRSLPIIDLDAEIQITPDTPIDTKSEVLQQSVPDDPSYKAVAVDIKICFKYLSGIVSGSEQDITVNYKLISDYKNPKGFRMYFKPQRDTQKSQTFAGTSQVSTSGLKVCTDQFQAYFNADIYDFRHVYFKLEADVEETQFFSKRFVLNQKLVDAAETRVVMQSGCTKPSGVCQADLELAPVTYTILPKGWDDIAIGRTDYILFTLNVTNNGEDDAFLSELSVVLPRNIIFNRRQAVGEQTEDDIAHIKCITKQQEDFTNKVICSISSELKVGTSEIFGLSVITTNIETISPKQLTFDFFAYVQEPSEELSTLLDDNKQSVTINVGYPSGIEIRGRPLRERQPFSNDKEYVSTENTKSIGPDVRHELEVYIFEDSESHQYHNIEIQGLWPLKYPNSDDYLLDLIDYNSSQPRVECLFGEKFNVKSADSTSYSSRNDESESKRSTTVQFRTKREDEDVRTNLTDNFNAEETVSDCSFGAGNCEPFSCTVDTLEQKQNVSIMFLSILNIERSNGERTTLPSMSITPYFEVIAVAQSNVVFGPTDRTDGTLQMVQQQAASSGYTWIIIASIIVGLLIVTIIAVVLVCCYGFFKKNKKDESGSKEVVDSPPKNDNVNAQDNV